MPGVSMLCHDIHACYTLEESKADLSNAIIFLKDEPSFGRKRRTRWPAAYCCIPRATSILMACLHRPTSPDPALLSAMPSSIFAWSRSFTVFQSQQSQVATSVLTCVIKMRSTHMESSAASTAAAVQRLSGAVRISCFMDTSAFREAVASERAACSPRHRAVSR
jgi:hypothetical protein